MVFLFLVMVVDPEQLAPMILMAITPLRREYYATEIQAQFIPEHQILVLQTLVISCMMVDVIHRLTYVIQAGPWVIHVLT